MLLNRAHVLLKDDRRDIRIADGGRLAWQIKYKQKEGHARVYDISASGMRMETNVAFDPSEECILSFDSCLGQDNYIPKLGRLVWSRKKRFSRDKYFCGIKFLESDPDVLARMREKVTEGVAQFVQRRKVMTIIGFLVSLGCLALIGYIVWVSGGVYEDVAKANRTMARVSSQQAVLTRHFVKRQRAAEAALAEETEKLRMANQIIQEERAALALYSKELEATKALLGETEMILDQSNAQNAALTAQNRALSEEIELLQSRVQARLANKKSVVAVANVKGSMEDYRRQLQTIKDAMKQLKAQERAARIAAIAAMDQQRSLLGNNGYFIKSGQFVQVDPRYHRLHPQTFINQSAVPATGDVEIDIKFFE